jgi:hypothetical protein
MRKWRRRRRRSSFVGGGGDMQLIGVVRTSNLL